MLSSNEPSSRVVTVQPKRSPGVAEPQTSSSTALPAAPSAFGPRSDACRTEEKANAQHGTTSSLDMPAIVPPSSPFPAPHVPSSIQVPNAEVADLLRVIDTPPVPLSRGWYVRVDQALIQLLNHSDIFNVPAYLQSLVTDSTRDSVVRVYALQYAAEWIEKTRPDLGELSSAPADAKLIIELFWAATKETRIKSLPGTALLNLGRLASSVPAIDQARLNQAAMDIAQNLEASIADRATALNVCGLNATDQSTKLLVAIAMDSEEHRFLRIAALGAMSRPQTATIENNMRRIADSDVDSAVRAAARSALVRLQNVKFIEVMQ